MNILSIGSDRTVFDAHSRVRARLCAYGEEVDAYHVVIMCGRSVRYTEEARTPSTRVMLHPTYSWSRFSYPFDVYRAGLHVLRSTAARTGWIVTAQDPFESGLAAWLLARRCGLPLQVQLHTDPFSPTFRAHSWLNVVRMYIAGVVLSRATRVRVVSESLRRMVHERYRVSLDRIDVLPVLVEPGNAAAEGGRSSPLRSMVPADSKIILMVGRLAPEKDWDTAFDAFQEILTHYPNTYLAIVGDGPLRPQLEKKASNQIYENKVLFLGWQNTVAPYYQDVDLFLFTSQYEGYGMVLIEAALAGVAIVSTDVGIAKEYFGDHDAACVCSVGDSDCLAREMQALLRDDAKRCDMGMRAKQRAETSYTSTLGAYAARQAEIWNTMLLTK